MLRSVYNNRVSLSERDNGNNGINCNKYPFSIYQLNEATTRYTVTETSLRLIFEQII